MFNIPIYKRYNGEKRIALLDNSAIEFMLHLENRGRKPEMLLQDYEVIFLPEWVMAEVQDSEYRTHYVEKLVKAGLPIRLIQESSYSELMNDEEINLYYIVKSTVSKIGVFLKYMRLNVEKEDLLDLVPYDEWIQDMYINWPLPEDYTVNGRARKKNAGEISLTILSEIFSWQYPKTEVLTVYTQDIDAYVFQKHAEEELKKIFKNKTPVSVTYRSNDSIMCQMYRNDQLTIEEIKDIRKDARYVTYTIERPDKTVAVETKKLNNEEFVRMVVNNTIQIIF